MEFFVNNMKYYVIMRFDMRCLVVTIFQYVNSEMLIVRVGRTCMQVTLRIVWMFVELITWQKST